MKFTHTHAFIIALFFALIATPTIQAQSLKGSGNVIKEDRNIQGVDRVVLGGVFKIYLFQGSEESLVVEADDNLLPYIQTSQQGDKLRISLKDKTNLKKSTKMNIYLTIRDISELEVQGVNTVKSEEKLDLKDLKIVCNGVGQTSLELECDKLTAKVTGVGELKLKGSAREFELRNTGVGDVSAANFVVRSVSVHNTGVGSSRVHATEELEAIASGVGQILYKGNPAHKNIDSGFLSRVTRMD